MNEDCIAEKAKHRPLGRMTVLAITIWRKQFAVRNPSKTMPAGVTLIVMLVCGCASPASAPARPAIVANDELLMRDKVLAVVPIGTPASDAFSVMESYGFKCVESQERSGDVIRCSYSEKDGIWVTWVWRVRCDLVDGKVAGVDCSVDGVGP